MQEKTKEPEIRFAGFTGAWEQRKLSDLCSMHARIGWQNLRTSEFLDQGQYLLITGTDFDNGSIRFNSCHFVKKERYDQDKNIQVKNGSILITKDGTLGKVAYVENLNKPATLNAGVFNVKTKGNDVDNKYLFQYLKAPFLMKYVDEKSTGGTIKHLNQSILVNFPVVLPGVEEQRKIGEFLSHIDSILTLHQRKYEKLLNIKKSMLEKMFPKEGEVVPEIRFKGFTGAWEQRKLGNLGETYTGLSGKSKEDFGHGTAKFITYMNVYSNPVSDPEGTDLIEVDNRQNTVRKGDVLFTTSSETPEEVGMSSVVFESIENTYLNSFCFGYRPKIEFNNFYLAFLLRSGGFRKNIIFLAQGISRYNISKNAVMNIPIPIPAKEEQEAIGDFFKHLDALLTLHQRKLEMLKNVKQAFLEKMFV